MDIDDAIPQHSMGLVGFNVAGMVVSALASGVIGVYQATLLARRRGDHARHPHDPRRALA